MMLFFSYLCVLSLGCSYYVVSNSASDCLERLVSEMTCNVLMGTLNPTRDQLRRAIEDSALCQPR